MDLPTLPWSHEILIPGSGQARVMLIGGFGAGPESLRELGDAIAARAGATVLVAGIARHTGDAREFLRSRSWHFLNEAERRFLSFWQEGGHPVLLGGYSTGALLALLIAARHPDKVTALVLASPALRLARAEKQVVGYAVGSFYYIALPAALLGSLLALAWGRHRGRRSSKSALVGALGSVAVVATAAAGVRSLTVPLETSLPLTRDGQQVLPPHFTRASLVTGSTLVPLQLVARWRLRRLTLPVCLVFGEEDEVVDVRFATLQAAASRRTELHVVPKAPHRVVTVGECHSIVCDFVARHAHRPPDPSTKSST